MKQTIENHLEEIGFYPADRDWEFSEKIWLETIENIKDNFEGWDLEKFLRKEYNCPVALMKWKI